MEAQVSAGPKEIRLGILCLWTALVIGLVNRLVHALRFGVDISLVLLCSQLVVTFLFSAFFIHKISQGRSWARATYLILLLFGVAITLLGLADEFGLDPVMAVTSVARVVVLLYAMYLLFTYPSDAWFESHKKLAAAR